MPNRRALKALLATGALLLVAGFVNMSDLGGSPVASASTTGLIVDVDFDGDFTNDAPTNGGSIAAVANCVDENDPDTPCNGTTSFGSDNIGTFWSWTTSRNPGGGLKLTTNSAIGNTNEYTVGIRFSFAQIDGYRKIMDYKAQASDTGFYVRSGKINFYNLGQSNDALVGINEVVDLLAVRSIDNGVGIFTVYLVSSSGVTKVLSINDAGNQSVPSPAGAGSVFGLFYDDTFRSTDDEYSNAGKVYSVRLWDRALEERFIASALGTPLDGSQPVTDVTTATTTTAVSSPSPVLTADGKIPNVRPGRQRAFRNQEAVDVKVDVEKKTDLVVTSNDFGLRLKADCKSTCNIETRSDGRQILSLERQGNALVSGEGFVPGSQVNVWLFSTPALLGQLTVEADGKFSGQVPISNTAVGEHTLQVTGTGTDGAIRTVNLGVIVKSSSVLPATGSDSEMMRWVVALITLGGVALLLRRRYLA